MYDSSTGIVVIRDGTNTTTIQGLLDLSDLSALPMTKVRDSDNEELFSGTTEWTTGTVYELDVESLFMDGTALTWTWQDMVDDGTGTDTYIADPEEEADISDIVVNANDITVDNGGATLKYMRVVIGTDFNAEYSVDIFSSAANIYQVAYIRDVEEMHTWGEPVQNWSNDPATTYATLTDFTDDYIANRKVFTHDDLPDGQGLILESDGTLTIVDSNGDNVTTNAGTYTVDGTTLKTLPTYAGYNGSDHSAFIEENGTVNYAEWSPVDNGGIFTLYDETAKADFIAWFNTNESTITDELWFEEGKSNWRTEFDGIVGETASDFVDLPTIYSIGVDEN